MALRWADRNLSRLEVIFVVTILLVIFSIFLNRALNVFISAEKTMVQNTIVGMETALRFHALYYEIKGDMDAIRMMQGMNPIELMTAGPEQNLQQYADINQTGKFRGLMIRPPSNYSGEFEGENATSVPKGQWYFDHSDRSLVYHVRSTGLIGSNVIGTDRLRYSVTVIYDDTDQDGQFTPGVEHYRALKVVPHEEYVWRID